MNKNIAKGMGQACLLAALAFGAGSALAGGFVPLPTTGADIRVVGNGNLALDPTYLGTGWTPTANGYTFVTSTSREFFTDDDLIGTFYDAVYSRDSDQTLMFATRIVLNVEEDDTELNLLWRSGFDGYTTAVAWYRQTLPGETPQDFRLQASASTGNPFSANIANPVNMLPAAGNYDPNTVGFRTDVSVDEGAPNSGWYLIQTNAKGYTELDDAAHFRMNFSATEMREEMNWYANAFAPVPEPSEYAMLAVGLTLIGFVVRRRQRNA